VILSTTFSNKLVLNKEHQYRKVSQLIDYLLDLECNFVIVTI